MSYFEDNAAIEAAGVRGAKVDTAPADPPTPWVAKGDMQVGVGLDAATRVPVGANGKVLTADSTETAGVKWVTPTDVVGAVATDAIFDAKGDLAVGTATNVAVRLPVGAPGQVLTAASGETAGMEWAAIPAQPNGTSVVPIVLTFDGDTPFYADWWPETESNDITVVVRPTETYFGDAWAGATVLQGGVSKVLGDGVQWRPFPRTHVMGSVEPDWATAMTDGAVAHDGDRLVFVIAAGTYTQWASTTAYANDALVVVDGKLCRATEGTSGGAEPTIGDDESGVADNDITWAVHGTITEWSADVAVTLAATSGQPLGLVDDGDGNLFTCLGWGLAPVTTGGVEPTWNAGVNWMLETNVLWVQSGSGYHFAPSRARPHGAKIYTIGSAEPYLLGGGASNKGVTLVQAAMRSTGVQDSSDCNRFTWDGHYGRWMLENT